MHDLVGHLFRRALPREICDEDRAEAAVLVTANGVTKIRQRVKNDNQA